MLGKEEKEEKLGETRDKNVRQSDTDGCSANEQEKGPEGDATIISDI